MIHWALRLAANPARRSPLLGEGTPTTSIPRQSRSPILDDQSALDVHLMRCASAMFQRDRGLNGDLAPYPKIAEPWT